MNANEMYLSLKPKLERIVPDAELRYKAGLACEINELKAQKNAVILAHNYMEPTLFHSIADVQGDSLELSRRVVGVTQDIIVFCGVRFMAETAKLLNPSKTVLLPSLRAGCSLAGSITANDVRRLKERFPGVPVVTYINTYADVKAESDICCTSGNAAKVVASLKSDTVIFIPDQYLAANVARDMGREIVFPDLNDTTTKIDVKVKIIGWRGACEVHEKFKVKDVLEIRRQFPGVVVLAHPECPPEVVAVADFSGSTSAMIKYVETTPAPQYLLLTECAMGDNIAAANPDREMLRLCTVRCPHMNSITMENTLESLRLNRYVIEVPAAVQVKARRAIEAMLAIH
jgi:quinolinate synthase